MPEPDVKKWPFFNLSFFLSVFQDYHERSPWFEYKSTPFWNAHVCGMLVNDLIGGVYSIFYEWVSDSPFCHIMRMLIQYCHGEVMWLVSVAPVRRCIQDLLERSADQLSELSIMLVTYKQYNHQILDIQLYQILYQFQLKLFCWKLILGLPEEVHTCTLYQERKAEVLQG